MSIWYYGVRFSCDLCHAQADTDERPAKMTFQDVPPTGWQDMRLLTVQLKDAYGSVLSHLCPDCRALSVGEMGAKMAALWEAEKVKT